MFGDKSPPNVSITNNAGTWMVESNVSGELKRYGPFTSEATAQQVYKQELEKYRKLPR